LKCERCRSPLVQEKYQEENFLFSITKQSHLFFEKISQAIRFLTVTLKQATFQTTTFHYLSVITAEFSLTYVTNSVEQSLRRRAHIKFALSSRVDEGYTEHLRDHGNKTKAAHNCQQPMELAMSCLKCNLYSKISDMIPSLHVLSLSGLHLTKKLKYRYAPHNNVSVNDGLHI
jgi:hypothetical protein